MCCGTRWPRTRSAAANVGEGSVRSEDVDSVALVGTTATTPPDTHIHPRDRHARTSRRIRCRSRSHLRGEQPPCPRSAPGLIGSVKVHKVRGVIHASFNVPVDSIDQAAGRMEQKPTSFTYCKRTPTKEEKGHGKCSRLTVMA